VLLIQLILLSESLRTTIHIAKFNVELGMIYKIVSSGYHLRAFKTCTVERIVTLSAGFKYSILEAKLYIISQRKREREISVIHSAEQVIKSNGVSQSDLPCR